MLDFNIPVTSRDPVLKAIEAQVADLRAQARRFAEMAPVLEREEAVAQGAAVLGIIDSAGRVLVPFDCSRTRPRRDPYEAQEPVGDDGISALGLLTELRQLHAAVVERRGDWVTNHLSPVQATRIAPTTAVVLAGSAAWRAESD